MTRIVSKIHALSQPPPPHPTPHTHQGGDLIPADLRVLECSDNLVIDNSALTGESEPQKRKAVCTHDDPLETQVSENPVKLSSPHGTFTNKSNQTSFRPSELVLLWYSGA